MPANKRRHVERRTDGTTDITLRQLTAGIPGAELIRRRQDSLCVACGVTKMYASSTFDVPWLCERCLERVPAPPRFNYQEHREAGIRNLERLDKGDDAA